MLLSVTAFLCVPLIALGFQLTVFIVLFGTGLTVALAAGLRCRCPNCGARLAFGLSVWAIARLNACPNCGASLR